jgi:hypothetical protein
MQVVSQEIVQGRKTQKSFLKHAFGAAGSADHDVLHTAKFHIYKLHGIHENWATAKLTID